jgi:hypothetical protein
VSSTLLRELSEVLVLDGGSWCSTVVKSNDR